jgi:protein-S-isoprenylcysteine O-methyltransferase Ste14
MMRRTLHFLYGLAAYLVFLGTFLYAIGFITGWLVPKHIDSGAVVPLWQALTVNLLLLTLFAVQHSGMARRQFKAWLTQWMSPAIERSTFVLLASLVLILLFWQWRPIPAVVWSIPVPEIAIAVQALALIGVVIVLVSTFLINHFELFGLQQVVYSYLGRDMPKPRFKTPSLYKAVRHPIYFGFIVLFWAAPVMTVGHLLFAAVTTAYILVGIWLEERDLVAMFGDDYRRYRERVAMLIPSMGRAERAAAPRIADGGKAAGAQHS